MIRDHLNNFAVTLVLLFVLSISGAAASETIQSGFITVGLPPVAQFDAHYAFSTVPTKVIFVDNSLGTTPMTYEWDFGDGTTSAEQNPVHMYLQRGTYTVSLTVKNAYGTSSAIKRNFITIGMGPRADFSGSPPAGNAPLTVKFTDQSLGQTEKWTWDFGDGKGSSEQNPVHTYWSGGVYNVLLTVSNEYGSSDMLRTNYITVVGELRSIFSADPSSGKAPLDVRFTDRSPGSPEVWSWDFGDNTTSNERNPTHRYAVPGSYDVNLTVTRGSDRDSSTHVVNVGGVPITDFVGTPRSGNIGELITFTDRTENHPTEWSWEFGDTATSADPNPTHSYQLKGIYTVSLTAKNSNGKDTETKQEYINIGTGPKADFIPVIVPYQKTRVPMKVRFVDQSANLPTVWQWDFGDGQTSDAQNPEHLYMNEGAYTVRLTVRNNFGQDTKVRNNLIVVEKDPAVDFIADKTAVGVGRVVTFSDLSSNSPTNWVWDFGDGTTGSGAKPDHVYRATGVYDVTLTVSNTDMSNSRTKNQYITVLDLPRADFSADRTRGGAPLEVNFIDKSSGMPASWQWDFGDGSTSTDKNPVHRYTTLGSFTVTLTVANTDGQDTTSRGDYIVTTLAPVAEFKADRQTGKAPFVVHFTDLSMGSPTSWSWEFGDGTGSSEQNPSHIYMNEGAYDVRLTVTNQYGSDTVFKTGSAAPATSPPIRSPTPEAAQETMVATTVATAAPAMTEPAATKSPLLPMVAVVALIAGLLLAAGKK
jgi:PKD repeat protein